MEEICENGIKATKAGKYPKFYEMDSAVIAVGMRPVVSIANDLEEKVTSLYVVGDCAKLGRIRDAIAGGFQAAVEI